MKIKARGSWASYRDENDKSLWRCDLDEMATTIMKDGWGGIPRSLSDKKAMEICLLAESSGKRYLRILEDALISHGRGGSGEHATKSVTRGDYLVEIQTETDHVRNVRREVID